jgi:hypothetical protein
VACLCRVPPSASLQSQTPSSDQIHL